MLLLSQFFFSFIVVWPLPQAFHGRFSFLFAVIIYKWSCYVEQADLWLAKLPKVVLRSLWPPCFTSWEELCVRATLSRSTAEVEGLHLLLLFDQMCMSLCMSLSPKTFRVISPGVKGILCLDGYSSQMADIWPLQKEKLRNGIYYLTEKCLRNAF